MRLTPSSCTFAGGKLILYRQPGYKRKPQNAQLEPHNFTPFLESSMDTDPLPCLCSEEILAIFSLILSPHDYIRRVEIISHLMIFNHINKFTYLSVSASSECPTSYIIPYVTDQHGNSKFLRSRLTYNLNQSTSWMSYVCPEPDPLTIVNFHTHKLFSKGRSWRSFCQTQDPRPVSLTSQKDSLRKVYCFIQSTQRECDSLSSLQISLRENTLVTSAILLMPRPPFFNGLHTSFHATFALDESFGDQLQRNAEHKLSISSIHAFGKQKAEHQKLVVLAITDFISISRPSNERALLVQL